VAIDYWRLTKDYKKGDSVQRFAPGTGGFALSPFVGRVTAVHPGLGVLDVQFPYGNERVFPDDIIRVDSRITGWLPPTLDQTYMSWDVVKDRQANNHNHWRTTELPAGFHVDLARLWSRGASEVGAYDEMWRRYASQGAQDVAIRDEVGKFYLVASNLVQLLLQQTTRKTGAYWAASNRQYRATSGDLGTRKPACPKCGSSMRKATYKMDKGARVKLFACSKDLFLIRQADLVGPTGEPVEW
jgi:hypothetical protein